MAKKRNIIVGQSGGPTAVINSSLAGVYKTAKERGFHKVYGMLHGVQGFLDEQYVDHSGEFEHALWSLWDHSPLPGGTPAMDSMS